MSPNDRMDKALWSAAKTYYAETVAGNPSAPAWEELTEGQRAGVRWLVDQRPRPDERPQTDRDRHRTQGYRTRREDSGHVHTPACDPHFGLKEARAAARTRQALQVAVNVLGERARKQVPEHPLHDDVRLLTELRESLKPYRLVGVDYAILQQRYQEALAQIHGQEPGRQYSTAEVKELIYPLDPRPTEDQGPAANCHLCVGAGGYEDHDGTWIECSCQRKPRDVLAQLLWDATRAQDPADFMPTVMTDIGSCLHVADALIERGVTPPTELREDTE